MKIVASEITVRNAHLVVKQVVDAVRGGDLEIDFESVKKVDSSALAVVLAAKRATPKGSSIRWVHCPPQFDGLVQAYSVQSLFS